MLFPTLIFLFVLVLFYLLLGGALLIDALRRAVRARSGARIAKVPVTGLSDSAPAGGNGRRHEFTVGPARDCPRRWVDSTHLRGQESPGRS